MELRCRRPLLGLVAAATMAGSVILLGGCAGTTPGASVENGTPSASPSTEVAGGMDGAGNVGLDQTNTSAAGPVTTTLGDFLIEEHSDTLLSHVYQEGVGGQPSRLFLLHSVVTLTRTLVFEFDYQGGSESFGVTDRGFLSLGENAQERVAQAGTVRIEPMGTDLLQITFSGVTLGPDAIVGDGAVSGPVRRVCWPASGVVTANHDGDPPNEATGAPPSLDDQALKAAFCP